MDPELVLESWDGPSSVRTRSSSMNMNATPRAIIMPRESATRALDLVKFVSILCLIFGECLHGFNGSRNHNFQ